MLLNCFMIYLLGAIFTWAIFTRLDPRPPRGMSQVLGAALAVLLWPMSLPLYLVSLL